jgi:hypothetical protein
MTDKRAPRRDLCGVALLGIALLAAGCQSNGAAAPEAAAEPAPPKVTQSELLAFCPPVGLREGTAFFTTYGPAPAAPRKAAAQDDAAEAPPPAQPIRYQTSITDVTRTCTRASGQLNMTVAVAGKVVPGPAGAPGSLTLPIRIAVVNGPDVLFSQIYQHPVQVASATAATTFLFTASDVTFADLGVRSMRGFAGFDEGPKPQAD